MTLTVDSYQLATHTFNLTIYMYVEMYKYIFVWNSHIDQLFRVKNSDFYDARI